MVSISSSLLLSCFVLLCVQTTAAATSSPPSRSTSQEVSLGTTLLAVCYKNGVVVGADTRTSVGTYVSNRYAYKLTPILGDPSQSSNIVVARSGSAADTQYLATQVERTLRDRYYRYGEHPTVSKAAHLLRHVMMSSSNEMLAGLLCVGCDGENGSIFSIAPSGTLMKEECGYAWSGSGSTYIVGLVDQEYRADMSEEEAIDLVTRAIRLAMQRDGGSGGLMRIHVLKTHGKSETLTIEPTHARGPIKSSLALKGFAPASKNIWKS